MRSYLSLIPISAKVHRRQNRMTLLCIIFAVFLVTAIFSMVDLMVRCETGSGTLPFRICLKRGPRRSGPEVMWQLHPGTMW